jgi:hypothetical protein
MRHEFELPEGDVEFLNAQGLPWETVRVGGVGRLIIYDFPIPAGYEHDRATLNLRIEPAYPETQIDMVYFLPALERIDGAAIPQISADQFDEKTWQRWSRHRTGQNPWRPGVDDVGSHLALVRFWLERELIVRPRR